MTAFSFGCSHGIITTMDGLKLIHGKENRLIFLCEKCNKIIVIETTIIELPK